MMMMMTMIMTLTHGVASIPLFGLDGRSPSVLGELRELLFPVGHGVFVNTGGSKARRGADTVK